MSPTAAPRPAEITRLPAWVRAVVATALWCWLAVALAFGVARAVVAVGAELSPASFALYSVLVFALPPAVAALVVVTVVAGAGGASPPAWVHGVVVALALGGWTFFGTRSLGWALVYAGLGGVAAGVALLVRTRGNPWGRAGLLLAAALALGLVWAWVETLD